jgi:hypothetical protein
VIRPLLRRLRAIAAEIAYETRLVLRGTRDLPHRQETRRRDNHR